MVKRKRTYEERQRYSSSHMHQPEYLPTEQQIRAACLRIQESWSETEELRRVRGEDQIPYGVEDWMICPECQKISNLADEKHAPWAICTECVKLGESLAAGRYCNGLIYSNGRQERQDIAYHGRGTNRSDNDVWWYGL